MADKKVLPMYGSVPPHDTQLEMAVLGAAMVSESAVDHITRVLKESDFYELRHQYIFRAIISQRGANKNCDELTVKAYLKENAFLAETGGFEYLSELTQAFPNIYNIAEYCDILLDKSQLRQLINACQEVAQTAFAEQSGAKDIIDSAEASIYGIAQDRIERGGGMIRMADAVSDAMRMIDERSKHRGITGISTGFDRLDRLTNGFQKGDLVIIAARPGMGKTAIALNMATHAALRSKKTVAFFSLEMGAAQLIMRVLCAQAQVGLQAVMRNGIEDSDYSRLMEVSEEIGKAKYYIYDRSNLNVIDVLGLVRRLGRQEQKQLDLIVIDYLQLMKPATAKKSDNRNNEVAEMSRSLKVLARELQVPVIVISQLNRGLENRKDHTPQLSDLRDSGAIEQDADMVIFVHREDYFRKGDEEGEVSKLQYESGPNLVDASLILSKHRNGPTGVVPLKFNKELTMFYSEVQDER